MAGSYKTAQITIKGPDLLELRNAFKQLPSNIAARVIGAGLKRAAKPGEDALKQLTPKGPTGNLRRSIKTKVKRYPRDGAAVAVVGYVKAGTGSSRSAQGGSVRKGNDRSFHQFWLEFGTSDRFFGTPADTPYARLGRGRRKIAKRLFGKNADQFVGKQAVRKQGGYIASSFNRLGPFTLKRSRGNGRVATSPKYPKAFFKKSKGPIHLPGVSAQHPVERAFKRSQSAIAGNLTTEMRKALENGRKILEDQARRASQMKDLEKHL